MKFKSTIPSSQKTQLVVIIFAYAIFASVFGYAYRYAISPDVVSLLRLAGYIAEGNFQQSVTSSWSPFFIWVLSPFLFLGFDGLTAVRIAIALCGAGLLYSSWLLTLRFDFSQNLRFIIMLIAALLIANWSIFTTGADVLLAAFILFYIYLLTHENIIRTKYIPFLGGIVGGFAYLAHHYALPFFLVHFPAMLLLGAYFNRDTAGFPWRKIFPSWIAGITGFLIIVSPWFGIVSAKYGQMSISSKGKIAHAAMGPDDIDRRHPFFVGGLYKPKDAYAIHVYEDPSEVEFKTWSPFESKEYFIHQLRLIKINLFSIFDHFVRKSPFFTYAFIIGTLTLIPIAFLLNPLNSEKRFLYSWFILTFSIYCSGFLIVIARSPRRFFALMIIFVFLSFHFLEELINGIRDIISGRRSKILTLYILSIIVIAFALKPGVHLLKSLNSIITAEQVNPYEDMARQINVFKFPSPYAIIRSSQKPHTDYYIAYYLKKQLLGKPYSKNVEGITKELKAAGGESLLVFDNLNIVERLKKNEKYIHIVSKKFKNVSRYLHAVNIEQDEIIGWDNEVNIFTLKK